MNFAGFPGTSNFCLALNKPLFSEQRIIQKQCRDKLLSARPSSLASSCRPTRKLRIHIPLRRNSLLDVASEAGMLHSPVRAEKVRCLCFVCFSHDFPGSLHKCFVAIFILRCASLEATLPRSIFLVAQCTAFEREIHILLPLTTLLSTQPSKKGWRPRRRRRPDGARRSHAPSSARQDRLAPDRPGARARRPRLHRCHAGRVSFRHGRARHLLALQVLRRAD